LVKHRDRSRSHRPAERPRAVGDLPGSVGELEEGVGESPLRAGGRLADVGDEPAPSCMTRSISVRPGGVRSTRTAQRSSSSLVACTQSIVAYLQAFVHGMSVTSPAPKFAGGFPRALTVVMASRFIGIHDHEPN
jgi:hypothetical protein